jgi:predicted RNA-binding Zn ribbon-like protein
VRAVALADVVSFLNSLDERRFGDHAEKSDRDRLASPTGFKWWLRERGFVGSGARITARDLADARELRSGLRALLPDNDTAGKSLIRLAQRFPLVVSFEGREPVLTPARGGIEAFLAGVLATCAAAAIDGRWARVKMCAADDCRFVFFDQGRNRLGRWCAMEACGSRMKARSYRARQARRRERKPASRT